MTTIDHLIYGVADLASAVDELERVLDVRAAAGGRHPGIGTCNALLALGPRTYLEVLAPDPDQAEPGNPRPFGLDDLQEPHPLGWAVGCSNIDRAIATSRAAGYDPGAAIEMTRTSADGATLRWRLTLNALEGGVVPFLIDWSEAQHPASSAPSGLLLSELVIEHPEPISVETTLHALGADVVVKPAAAPALVAHLTGPHGTRELR
jgi:hypothetical protein